jgi:hypothetical protein
VLGATESTLQRWNTGRGQPDDAHSIRLAEMAGLDPGYVVASMRSIREKDPELRAFWAHIARRLLLTSGTDAETPPPEGGDDENGSGDGGGNDPDSSDPVTHIMRSTAVATPADARLRRIAKAALGRALKLKKSH